MKHHLILTIALFSTPAYAHDGWINWGGYKGIDGTHCCGDRDCETVPDNAVKITRAGYAISYRSQFPDWKSGMLLQPVNISEIVPFSETQTSEDSHYWRCQKNDNTRRCFFAPQPGS